MRFAGQWDPPPALFRTIAKWCASTYAEHILGMAERKIERLHAPVEARKQLAALQAEQLTIEPRLRALDVGETAKFKEMGLNVLRDAYGYAYARGKTKIVRPPSIPFDEAQFIKRNRTTLEEVLAVANDWFDWMIKDTEKKVRVLGPPGDPRKVLVSLELLRRECLKYTSTAKRRVNKVVGTFSVDISGWKYLTPEEQKAGTDKMTKSGFERIHVELLFAAQHDAWSGFWSSSTRTISIDAPGGDENRIPSLALFQKNMHEMISTVWHEVQHAGHSLLLYFKDLDEIGGLPSKEIRNPNVLPSGYPMEDKRRKPTRIQHHLRDVEFYTNLATDTHYLQQAIQTVTPSKREDFFRYFVGLTDQHESWMPADAKHWRRMAKLRVEAPEKWAKAYSELRKSIEHYLP